VTALPVPTLDHVAVNVHDRMDAAEACYRRLGFTLTPRGFHSLGSVNHLAIFGTDYLELIGLPAGSTGRQDLLAWPVGLNGLVWGTEESTATHEALLAAGVDCHPPGEFTRPVQLPGGPRDARFRTVRLDNAATPAGRLYFCQHFTRDLVWRDEWRRHANGTIGIAAAIIAAARPERLGGLFARMFGADAVRPIEGGIRLVVGLSDFEVVAPEIAARRFGPAAPAPDGRAESMAGLVLRTTSLDAAARIAVPGVTRTATQVLVPASEAFGCALAFQA
jgi:hypothetical protein